MPAEHENYKAQASLIWEAENAELTRVNADWAAKYSDLQKRFHDLEKDFNTFDRIWQQSKIDNYNLTEENNELLRQNRLYSSTNYSLWATNKELRNLLDIITND